MPLTNATGLLFIAICSGVLLAKISKTPEGIMLLTALDGLNVLLVMAVSYLIWFTPFCVFSLIVDNVLRNMDNLGEMGLSVLQYCGVVTLALSIQLFIILQVRH